MKKIFNENFLIKKMQTFRISLQSGYKASQTKTSEKGSEKKIANKLI